MKNSCKIVLLSAALCTTTMLKAQVIYDSYDSHVYESVSTVYPGEDSEYGEGYIMSTTIPSGPWNDQYNFDVVTKLIRTDANGTPYWKGYYSSADSAAHRFTHVEKFSSVWFGDQVHYLVVGSIDRGSSGNLGVAIIDDQGGVVVSREFSPSRYPFLTGIKGIYSASEEEIVVIAVESDGFNDTNNRNIVVVSLDDGLNIKWQHQFSTSNTLQDHDIATDIIEIPGGNYVMVGSCNKNYSSKSGLAALVAVINSGGVVCDKNYVSNNPSSGHSNNASSVVYNPNDNSIWVLGNSSLRHFFELTQFDLECQKIKEFNFYENYENVYGYKIKVRNDDQDYNTYVIAGYEHGIDTNKADFRKATPFLVEVDVQSEVINWANRYEISNAGSLYQNENDMLYKLAQGQFGAFYNTMMDYGLNDQGYTFLGNDKLSGSQYALRHWEMDYFGQYVDGDRDCAIDELPAIMDSGQRYDASSLYEVSEEISEEGDYLQDHTFDIAYTYCTADQGKRMLAEDSEEPISKKALAIFPNPAQDKVYITGAAKAQQLVLYNLNGQVVWEEKLSGKDHFHVDLSKLSPGLYLIKITGSEAPLLVSKLLIEE
jgi:hypothetical protein